MVDAQRSVTVRRVNGSERVMPLLYSTVFHFLRGSDLMSSFFTITTTTIVITLASSQIIVGNLEKIWDTVLLAFEYL